MSDIVERLRGEEWDGEIPLNVVDMLEDAADEITRLRAALREAGQQIEYLKVALRVGGPEYGPADEDEFVEAALAVIRAALGEKA